MFDGAGNNPGDKTLEDKFFEHEVFIEYVWYTCRLKLLVWKKY